MRTVTMMSVSEIMKRVDYSGDIGRFSNWEAVLAAKVSHDHFDWLADKIMQEGFTTPIVLSPAGDGYELGNGHHRFCAAILLGLDEVPVIISEAMWVTDSHDGDHELPPGSFEYWEMLRDNMSEYFRGDMSADAWRAQYRNETDSDASPCCCDLCVPPSNNGTDCVFCHEFIAEANGAFSAHMIGCPERDWEYLICRISCEGHYRMHMCQHARADAHAEALAEHMRRGHLPPGAWHPEAILTEAYEAHAEWMRDAEIRAARWRWEYAVGEMRAAVERGSGDYVITHYAQEVADAYKEWVSL